MEFDKSRIFTALNADELKIGSKVIVADSLGRLKECVESNKNICTLINITNEDCAYRFETNNHAWLLAYLIEEPEEVYYVGYDLQQDMLTWCNDCKVYKHVFRKFHTLKEVSDWIAEHKKFEPIMRFYELGRQIQYYEHDEEDWCDVFEPKWDIFYEYRVKPEGLKWTDLDIGDAIRNKKTGARFQINGIDGRKKYDRHIYFHNMWYNDEELSEWEKVND